MAQGASFRAGTFDPTLLLSQIVALQCSYYICLSLLVGLLAVLTGAPFTLHHLLSFTEIDSSTALGWSLFLAFLVTAFISCFLLLVIVERTRLCIDFACTLHLLHLLLVTFYSNSIPNSFLWWMLLIVSTVITALGGERLCIWREL
ncbi:hypothetical protein BASA62_001923 [Batrachochytrium salamandrivorans]|nr:hypothetical protein BASA62_001923 [Batrachochytrium salamandrivorans]